MGSTLRAVVLAAGKGTRMRSALPKVLHPAAGRPLLHYTLDLCHEIGAPALVVVGHEAEAVQAACGTRTGVSFARQEPQLGTGHAVQVALASLGEEPRGTVVVLAGDVPLLRAQTLRALCARREEAGAAAALITFRTASPSAYGRIVRAADGSVARVVEAKDATPAQRLITEVNASLYAFDAALLGRAIKDLRADNAQGEFYLTDVVQLLVGSGHKVEALVLEDAAEASGVNTPVELAGVESEIFRRRALSLVAAGAIIERPETVTIGPFVQLAPGARLRPFAMVEGASVVADGAVIGPFSRIEDSEIGPGAVILDSCLIRQSRISAGATIGPFAHLRPESVVGENAKVGNFVELKKTVLGAGSKAPHLSYLGDATVGSGANIGAGSITCNYDGVSKSKTIIEDQAFVGSNTIMVAPVRVGRGAYIAAGSVITKDVPEGALGVGRARQENKAGWAARRARKP